jgi:uncharacterized protein
MPGMAQLLALQAVDTALGRAAARRAALESGAGLREARDAADTAEGRLGELGLKLDELGRDRARLEHEIDSLTRKAADEEKRLYDGSIVNAKELGSLQHEIDNLKRRRSDREDELLVVMELREGVEAEAVQARSRSDELRLEAERVGAEAEAELGRIASEMTERGSERDRIAAAIDPEVLELYDDLRRQKKGVGAAALIDGVCQGCHEQLSAVELDRLKRTEGVRRCEHCRRILVF